MLPEKKIIIAERVFSFAFIACVIAAIIMFGICPGMHEEAKEKEKECGLNCTKEQKDEIYKKYHDYFNACAYTLYIGIPVCIFSAAYIGVSSKSPLRPFNG